MSWRRAALFLVSIVEWDARQADQDCLLTLIHFRRRMTNSNGSGTSDKATTRAARHHHRQTDSSMRPSIWLERTDIVEFCVL